MTKNRKSGKKGGDPLEHNHRSWKERNGSEGDKNSKYGEHT